MSVGPVPAPARPASCARPILQAERDWSNPIVTCQVFEYKAGHFLDKASPLPVTRSGTLGGQTPSLSAPGAGGGQRPRPGPGSRTDETFFLCLGLSKEKGMGKTN